MKFLFSARLPRRTLLVAALLMPAFVNSFAQDVPKAEGKITYSGSASSKVSKTLKKTQSPANTDSDQVGPLLSKIDVLVRDLMQSQRIPGLTLAVVNHRQIALSRAYGVADVENDVPMTREAEIRTASIAKPMTATAVMELVEQGKLDLDAPVQRYCPAFPLKTSPAGDPWPVTTRELLAHRAGMRWYQGADEERNTRHYADLNDAVKHFADGPPLFQPGTKMQYSSYGYVVVGCAIEGATHESYLDYIAQNVFDPAGMSSTMADDPQRIIPHRARGYDRGPDANKPGDLENAPFLDSSDRIPGGGFVSTAEDLVRFAAAVMSEKLVSRAMLEEMWKPTNSQDEAVGNSKAPPYGLGWGIGMLEGHRIVGHNGGQAGTSTTLKLVPDRQLAVAVMTNLEGAKLDDFAEAVLKLYLAEPQP